jgi:hypothetical protein
VWHVHGLPWTVRCFLLCWFEGFSLLQSGRSVLMCPQCKRIVRNSKNTPTDYSQWRKTAVIWQCFLFFYSKIVYRCSFKIIFRKSELSKRQYSVHCKEESGLLGKYIDWLRWAGRPTFDSRQGVSLQHRAQTSSGMHSGGSFLAGTLARAPRRVPRLRICATIPPRPERPHNIMLIKDGGHFMFTFLAI